MNAAEPRAISFLRSLTVLDAKAIERLAPTSLTLVLLYAGCLAVGNSPGNVLLGILAISALPIVALRQELRSRPILIFSLFIILYLLAMAVRAELEGIPGRHIRAIDNFAFVAFAPFVAVHVAIALRFPMMSFERLCLLAAAIFIAGSSARLFWNADWAAGLSLFGEYEWGAGGGNRNYLSIEAGLTLLASGSLLVLAVATRRWPPPVRLVVGGLLALVCALDFLALIEMKSRTNWIAATVAGLVWLVTLFVGSLRRGGARRSVLWGAAAAVAVLAAVGLAAFSSQIASRLSDNGGVTANAELLAGIVTGRLDRSSIDFQAYDPRLPLFVTARELIAMKPLFGWGTDVGPLVKEHVGVTALQGKTQFHDAYLEFLVAVGIVGTGLIAGHLAAVALACRRRTAPALDPDVGVLLAALAAGSLAYVGIVAIAESANRMEIITQGLVLLFALMLGRGSIGQAIERIAGSATRPQ
ncbi:O-antigen ligase family protein [Hypericibacter sp.]|uniref:O-antigen ligase family protein n=1 Tax=Hypericibacter sp. TaxID=2705401 RepID=UPI003D6D5E64